MDDSRLRVFTEMKAMQHSDAVIPCLIGTGLPCSFIRLSAPFKILFFLLSCFGFHSPPCWMSYCTRVSYLLANLRQWFSRYTCSPEGNSKILEIQFRDTSPADRSLRSRALIGIGLMARDTLFCSSVRRCFIGTRLHFFYHGCISMDVIWVRDLP